VETPHRGPHCERNSGELMLPDWLVFTDMQDNAIVISASSVVSVEKSYDMNGSSIVRLNNGASYIVKEDPQNFLSTLEIREKRRGSGGSNV
jgi:hypothetical protein